MAVYRDVLKARDAMLALSEDERALVNKLVAEAADDDEPEAEGKPRRRKRKARKALGQGVPPSDAELGEQEPPESGNA